MTLLYDDPCFLRHATGPHPEQAERLRAVAARLRVTGLDARCTRPQFAPCDRPRLARVHEPAYIDEIRDLAAAGGGQPEGDTVVSPASYDTALLAAGAVADAVGRVLRGEDRTALCLVRPPGHHALADRAMGFCLFNNVAVGAKLAVEEFQLDRVLIVDFDVHHCNGTQATFWEEPRVGTLSIHRWPFYPGTGSKDEQGGGRARGTKLNLPIEFGTPREDYLATFSASLETFAARLKPQLVLASAGFDAHRQDPIGNLGLETEDFTAITDCVLGMARTYAGGRLVSVLEGGYNPPVLAECVAGHLGRMLAG
jgi:acetoin utilization deacetylase AcuC-like enzyme